MTVYWSATPIDWRRSVPTIDWLGIEAPRAPLTYPPVLDVVESALIRCPTPLLTATAAALASRWEDLGQARQPTEPAREDAQDEANEAEEQLVLYAAARAVSELGGRYGCAFVIDPEAQPNARYFIAQLARMAEETGFALACTGDVSAFPSQALPRRLARPPDRSVPPRSMVLGGLAPGDLRVLRKLAVSRCGTPLTAALRLGLSREAAHAVATSGPDGADWVVLGARARRKLQAGLDAPDRRRYAAELFDAWPPGGWGYLRRSQLAVVSGSWSRLRGQHAALLAGYATIGREWLQGHVAGLATASSRSTQDHQIAAHLTAARMASRLRPLRRANNEAARHLHHARQLAVHPVERLDLTAELANAFANQRTPRLLGRARKLYVSGMKDIPAVSDAVQRVRLEIAFLNGLALVEYIEGANESALKLEERAEGLAFVLAELHPEVARWAIPLVCVNTAKLLSTRFNARQAAIDKLTTALTKMPSGLDHSDQIRRYLAQLYFTEGHYTNVIGVLDALCPENRLRTTSVLDEFQDRLLLATAQFRLGDAAACQKQLTPLQALAPRVGSEAAMSALNVLSKAVRSVNTTTS
ncbi:hypothetical protein AB0O22_32005 [Streptomyces sp. NPDC091204]|uniref:hypothetical protein n=1 Tax=Streptomyces sp. NPDC091204 TaxID=3155299 RepID=UPI00344748DC